MGIAKQIKMVMLDKGLKPSHLADMTGKNQQTIYNALSRDTFISKNTLTIADALQCDIVLRDRETGKIYD